MKVLIGWVTALAAGCALMAAPAAAAPLAVSLTVKAAAGTEVVKAAAARRKPPRRAYVDVPVRPRGPGPAPDCPGLTSWNPANPHRGFCDPGFAYHGNVNGCAIDQGYGRWASCDTLR